MANFGGLKTNITQDPGRDSRWAPHSGREEDTTRRTGTEAGGGGRGEGSGVVSWRGGRAGQVYYLRRGATGPAGVRE